MPHEYTIFRTPIRKCAQKLELHGGNTIIHHIEAQLLCFCMSHQTVHSLQHVCLDEGLEIWYFFNHVRDHGHIVQIHVWFHEKWYGGKILFMQFYAPTTEWRINVIMCMSHHQEGHKHIFEYAFATSNDQKQNTYQHLLSLAQLSSWTWRVGSNGFSNMGSRMVPTMMIYKLLSLEALPHKGVLFHNHQKGHGKSVLMASLDRARVLQMNRPCG